jgi:hypothetical protein
VERWSKLLCESREELEDKLRSGRVVTEITPENVQRIRFRIEDDADLTIEEL